MTCNTSTQDCPPRKRLSWQGQAQLLSGCMHDVHHNENCKTCCTTHLMIFKSSQPHLYLNQSRSSTTIWKVGPASVGVLSPCKTSESNRSSAFRKQVTVAVASMCACHDHKRRSSHSCHEPVLSKSSTGFKSHASNNADLCYPDKASFEKGDREGRPWSTAIARCHVGRSATPLVRSIHQFDRIRSSSGDRSGCLC